MPYRIEAYVPLTGGFEFRLESLELWRMAFLSVSNIFNYSKKEETPSDCEYTYSRRWSPASRIAALQQLSLDIIPLFAL